MGRHLPGRGLGAGSRRKVGMRGFRKGTASGGGLPDLDLHGDTGLGEHVDQRVDGELTDSPSHQVADTGLGGPHELAGFDLSESAALDEPRGREHQLGSDEEVPGLIGREADVFEDVPVGGGHALLGGTRTDVIKQVEQGFPFLPAGCHMELDRVASERVLESIRNALPDNVAQRAQELQELAARQGDVTLGEYLNATGLDVDEVYRGNHCWSDLRDRAELHTAPAGEHEETLRRACGRLLHVDDPARLAAWRGWLQRDQPPDLGDGGLFLRDARLFRMLLGQLLDQVPGAGNLSLGDGAAVLWAHPQVRRELDELFDVLEDRVSHLTPDLGILPDVPLHIHARYTRIEILAACGVGEGARVMPWQTGVRYVEELPADLFAFTLDKTSGGFSPTTRYRDYAISRELIHWESQSVTRADSETGRRYQEHAERGSHVLLFARLSTDQRAFHFLGPATYVQHESEQPMAITWKLEHRLPGDLYQSFAAAVA